jgi:phage-related protein
MVLLHGFIKKSQKTPEKEIALATKRMKGIEK